MLKGRSCSHASCHTPLARLRCARLPASWPLLKMWRAWKAFGATRPARPALACTHPPTHGSAEAASRRGIAESALSGALGAQVSEAVSGRGRLESAQEALLQLQSRFHEIDALCVECRDLVPHDDLIRLLSTVRANFEATLSKAVTILDLPEEAAHTLAALAQESELVVVYEELVALDAKCATAQRLFEDGAAASAQVKAPRSAAARARNEDHRARVASYFQKVDAARATFEERMWSQLREALHLGDSGAATCVRVLRVVQEQEAMDAERSGQAALALPYAARRYRQLALAAVEQAVDERCARLLPAALQPHEGEDELVMGELLLDAQECFRGLEDIYDFIVPCFPTDYNIWEVFVRRYHVRLVQFYDRVGALREVPGNSDILEVVRSHEEYVSLLHDFSTPPEWYDIKPVPVPYEAPPEPQPGAKGGRKPKNTREAVAVAEADARERARLEAAAQGGNWEGAAVVPVDATARALLKGALLDTAGLTKNIASGVAYGTMGVVKGVGNLVVAASGLGRGAAVEQEAPAEAPPEAPPPKLVPSAHLWTPGTGTGLDRLVDAYVRRMRDNTALWMANMVTADLHLPPQQEEGGRLWTPAGVDFFRIINEQLEAITQVTRGELLVRVVVAVSKLMLDFQKLQNGAVELPLSELSLEVLCAYVNNNERCYDLSNEVLEGLKEHAPDEQAATRLEVLELTDQGFLETAKAAMRKAVDASACARLSVCACTADARPTPPFSLQRSWLRGRVWAALLRPGVVERRHLRHAVRHARRLLCRPAAVAHRQLLQAHRRGGHGAIRGHLLRGAVHAVQGRQDQHHGTHGGG